MRKHARRLALRVSPTRRLLLRSRSPPQRFPQCHSGDRRSSPKGRGIAEADARAC